MKRRWIRLLLPGVNSELSGAKKSSENYRFLLASTEVSRGRNLCWTRC